MHKMNLFLPVYDYSIFINVLSIGTIVERQISKQCLITNVFLPVYDYSIFIKYLSIGTILERQISKQCSL